MLLILLLFITNFHPIFCATVITNDHINDRNLLVSEDGILDVPSIIRNYGYNCEVYDIITEDGYIIQLHRIPHGKNRTLTLEHVPVIVQHGLLASSADFIIAGPERALGYLLADAGYDVWLLNSRGNRYSQKHVKLNPNDDVKYWRFSWHEIGIYDLPATIDFVLNTTKRNKLFHIGYSQGVTSFLVMGSEKTHYLEKIIAHISYAPGVYMKYMHNPFFATLAIYRSPLEYLLRSINMNALFWSQIFSHLMSLTCSNEMINDVLCSNFLFALYGYNKKEMNNTLITTYVGHIPAGSSLDQIVHYGQLVNSHRFCKYDHGYLENWKRYGTIIPPNYNLGIIKTPIYMYYSFGDWYSDYRDVRKLVKELPNVKAVIEIDDVEWSHLDFLLGITAKEKIYDKTIEFMREYAMLPLK